MTAVIIDDTLPYTQSIANGSQTVFDTDWTADVGSDVVVYARATGVAANDVTQIVSPSLYNVTFVGAEQYVRVTFLSGRTLNDVITITRNTPESRDNLYINTNFTPSMLNGDFGRYLFMIQQNTLHWSQLMPRYNTSATVQPVIDTILPILPARYTWRKNAADTAIEIYLLPDGGIAPANATYITLTDMTANLPSSVNLASKGTGIMVNIAGSNIITRTLTGTANQIAVAAGNGVAANPTLSIVDNPIMPGTAGMGIPSGTTLQRVVPVSGIGLRYNTDTGFIEYYSAGVWNSLSSATALLALLASNTLGEGASLIGLNPSGTVQDLANAKFIVQQANATVPNAQSLGALTTGILKSTTVTGVISISVPLTSIDGLTTVTNNMLYATAPNTYGVIAPANSSVMVSSAGGVPSWSTTLPAGLNIPGFQPTITPAALSKTDDTNVTLTLGGSPLTALLAATSLTLGWAGQLGLTRGGTNASLVASNGGLVYSDATGLAILAGTATAGQIPRSGSSGAPSWSTATFASTYAASSLLYSNGANTVVGLATANGSVLTTGAGGVPAWVACGTSGNVLTSNGTTWVSSAASGGGAVIVAGTGTDSMKTTFGNDATATRGIRIGKDPVDPTSAVIGDDGIGIGSCSYVGTNAIVIGKEARGQGTDAICLGNNAKAGSGFGGGSKSIAIGYLASTSTSDNAMMLTTSSSQPPTPATGEWVLSSEARMRFYINGVQAANIGDALDIINLKGTADQGKSVQTPTTGFSITIAAGIKTLELTPAGTLATGTITMPAAPIDGQEIRIASTQQITALTLSGNAGQTISNAPSTLAAGQGCMFIYNLATTTWLPLYLGVSSPVTVALGGTGATTAAGARTNLGAAASGANADITSMTGLTGALQAPTGIKSSAGVDLVKFNYVASAVNYLELYNNTTTLFPSIVANGTDAAVGLAIQLKNSDLSLSDFTNTSGAGLRFYSAAGTQYTRLIVAAGQATTVTFVLPAADGTTGQFLKTDSAGNLTFSSTLPASAILGTPASGTLTNATGYTVANLADTAWTTFTPTCTGFSGTPTTEGRYKLIGKTAFVYMSISGTSNTTAFTVTNLPATAANTTTDPIVTPGQITNNSAVSTAVGGAQITRNSTTLTFYSTPAGGAWTNSGTKGAVIEFHYETT